MESVRLDKFLWSIRLYKTRSLASEACRAGRVKMSGQVLKASHEVKTGEVYEILQDQLHKVIQVKELLGNRISAKLIDNFYTDLTPQEEYERIQMARQYGFEHRDRGVGRPTKKDRRNIEEFKYK